MEVLFYAFLAHIYKLVKLLSGGYVQALQGVIHAVNSHFCAAFGSVVVPQHSGSLVCRQATRQSPAVTGDASVQQGALKLELNLSSFEQKQQQRTRVVLSARISRARQMLLKFTRVSCETSASVCLDVKPFCVGDGTKQCDAAAVCLTSS